MAYVNAVVNGLLVGGLFAGVGVGLSLIFGICNLLNLAHGAFIVVGAYGAFFLQDSVGITPLFGVVIVALAAYALGVAVYRYGGLSRAAHSAQSSPLSVVVFTFGVSLVIVNLVAYHYGGGGRSLDLPGFLGTTWTIGDVVISVSQLVVAVLALAMVAAVDVLIKRTKFGRGIRATRQDAEMASANGVDVPKAYARTFGLGCAATAVAGILITFTQPFGGGMDIHFLLIAFAVVLIGGLGRVDAVVAGGVVYGVLLSVLSVWLGSTYGMAATFALLLVLLLVRPQGILGSEYY